MAVFDLCQNGAVPGQPVAAFSNQAVFACCKHKTVSGEQHFLICTKLVGQWYVWLRLV